MRRAFVLTGAEQSENVDTIFYKFDQTQNNLIQGNLVIDLFGEKYMVVIIDSCLCQILKEGGSLL